MEQIYLVIARYALAITPRDRDHALQRMTKHACQLLSDARVIAIHQSDLRNGRRGEYLLRLIALEILMKAGALWETGHVITSSHSFSDLFEVQAEGVQAQVRSEFGARDLQSSGTEYEATLGGQLERLKENYMRARYLYEPSLKETEDERRERERAFLDGELPPAEWDIIYHNQLISLLLEVLLEHLSNWRPAWCVPLSNPPATLGAR